jgi:hypothetical protein
MKASKVMTAVTAGVGLVALVTILVQQPGPRWLWASDACPSIDQFCGQVAMGPFLALFFVTGVAISGFKVGHVLRRRVLG